MAEVNEGKRKLNLWSELEQLYLKEKYVRPAENLKEFERDEEQRRWQER